MDPCCICISDIGNIPLKKLSCGHYLHNRCYLKYTYVKLTKFIECPLCRRVNINLKRPPITYKFNLYELGDNNKINFRLFLMALKKFFLRKRIRFFTMVN